MINHQNIVTGRARCRIIRDFLCDTLILSRRTPKSAQTNAHIAEMSCRRCLHALRFLPDCSAYSYPRIRINTSIHHITPPEYNLIIMKLTQPAAFAMFSAILLAAILPAAPAAAQSCPRDERSELDERFCDANGDMTADAPKDTKLLKNPRSLLLTYSPQEDPATYEKMWSPYVSHMTQCTKLPMRFLQVHSSAASIEAMRSGRVQLSLLSAGDTPFAVNVAGAVPFANHGTQTSGIMAYH